MTKAELIEAVARATHQPKNLTAAALEAAFEHIDLAARYLFARLS